MRRKREWVPYEDLSYYPNCKATIERVYKHFVRDCHFNMFWKKLQLVPGIKHRFGKKTLYDMELLFRFFAADPRFAGYFEKQRLSSREEVVWFVEDREYYYANKWEIPYIQNSETDEC